jgi:alpha-amylase
MKRLVPISLLAASVAVAGGVVAIVVSAPTANASTNLNDSDVTANLWEWNWTSVSSACTNHLGPAGFGAVQVAPPQESVSLASSDSGPHPWWEVYQPVSYHLTSRLGDRTEFAAMVAACHTAGVRVYVDAVINHMAGANNTLTTTYGGSTFNPSGYAYPAVPYQWDDFHHPNDGYCSDSDGVIDDWNNTSEVQNCMLLSLSDLKTQSTTVRTKIAAYLNDLISLGVDGFRIDAAKHVSVSDFAAIRAMLNPTTAENVAPYIAQEVFTGATNNELKPAAFVSNGDVLGFSYAMGLRTQFNNGTLSNLATIPSWSLDATSDQTYAMVTNHDLERDGTTLRYQDGAKYVLANYFMLAYPYGQPSIYDGFTFSSNGQSPPSDSNGFVTDTNCGNSAWQCITHSIGVKGMVGWRNVTASATAVSDFTSTASNIIAFRRGSLGWIGINASANPSTATYTTGLANGTYCDVITGLPTATGCSGSTVTVSGGTAAVTIPGNSAVAIHVDARPGSNPTPTASPTTCTAVATTFSITAPTSTGDTIKVTGNQAGLSNWNTATAAPLTQNGSTWTGTATLPPNTSVQYKYIRVNAAGAVTWEYDPNRSRTTPSSCSVTWSDTWNGPGASCSTVAVTFAATATTVWGENVFVLGNRAELGNWNTSGGLALSAATYPVWRGTVSLPANTTVEYKYVKKNGSSVVWESGGNRVFNTGSGCTLTLNDTWR